MTEQIIFDCDPGHDDAMALILAAANPSIDLIAITTVAGNQTVDKTTNNALAVTEVVGLTQVPVARGAAEPLRRPPLIAPDIHGETGLDGPILPKPTRALDPRPAAELIVGEIMRRPPRSVSLVAVGPFTNLAQALEREPALAAHVKQVVCMGGSFTRGNRTPAAEFNILADPEAAEAVFAADWKVVQMGLDVTHQATLDAAVFQAIAAMPGHVPQFVLPMLEFFRSTYHRVQGFDWPPIHDACAIAYLIDPHIFTLRDAFVTVEVDGRWTTGMTVTDFDGLLGYPLNTSVATLVEVDRFRAMLVDAVQQLSQ